MLSLGGERLSIFACTMIWSCYSYYGVFLSLNHLRRPRLPQNLNQFFIVLPKTHKISSQSIHNFLSNVVHKQTNRQTNNATKNLASFVKEVIMIKENARKVSPFFTFPVSLFGNRKRSQLHIREGEKKDNR